MIPACSATGVEVFREDSPDKGYFFQWRKRGVSFVYYFFWDYGPLVPSKVELAHGTYPGVGCLQDRCLD